ncbi:MAG: NAD-dependent epimerase/dehydratase family protein [Flavobacteriales bacterium]|nr:NAD(P)-dependent oxidoreductase [Flavobacteriales bacterium]
MLIGSGMLANAFSAFEKDPEVCIFASGVSRSSETGPSAFLRELNLLSEQDSALHLVYFSTCSLYDPTLQNSPYILHKRNAEQLITERFGSNLIVRLPNMIGNTRNPNTLTNFLRDRILRNEHFEVFRNATRYLLDVDDIVEDLSPIIAARNGPASTLDVCGSSPIKLPLLVEMMEKILDHKGDHDLVDKGQPYQVDNSKFLDLIHPERSMRYEDQDLFSTLSKYYARSR